MRSSPSSTPSNPGRRSTPTSSPRTTSRSTPSGNVISVNTARACRGRGGRARRTTVRPRCSRRRRRSTAGSAPALPLDLRPGRPFPTTRRCSSTRSCWGRPVPAAVSPGRQSSSMAKVVDVSSVEPGGQVTYTITITNGGTDSRRPRARSLTRSPTGSRTCPAPPRASRQQIPLSRGRPSPGTAAAVFSVPGGQLRSRSPSLPPPRRRPGPTSTTRAGWGRRPVSLSTPTGPDRAGDCRGCGARDGQHRRREADEPGRRPAELHLHAQLRHGFQLADGQQNDSGALTPGTYSVSETGRAGWELTSAICSDGSDPSAIDLVSGETVICTFTNTQLVQTGNIVVEKQTNPDGDPQELRASRPATASPSCSQMASQNAREI